MTKKKQVVLYMTGYGPFAHIKVNPSSTIAKRVSEVLQHAGAVAEIHYTELETSVSAATEYFEKIEKEIDSKLSDESSDCVILLLHLGVHGQEKNGIIRVEVQGYNELFASVPDVKGVTLNHDPIVEADGPIDTKLESWFGKEGTPQLEHLAKLLESINKETAKEASHSMKSHKHHPISSTDSNQEKLKMPEFQNASWEISRDAGRYLCNCALYHALRLQEKHAGRVFGLFVHVVDPKQGKTIPPAKPDLPETMQAYNPTVMDQSEQLKQLVYGLIEMIEK